jgi:hypothetical protein
MRKWQVIFAALGLSLTPSLTYAHVLNGSGSWLDELVCLVPAAIMMVLVFVLGRAPKSRSVKKNKP